jgi:homoserine dehydrogenase
MGTVGEGACGILTRNVESIARQAGCQVRLACVADLRRDELRSRVPAEVRFVEDAAELIRSPDVQIVCELIGGTRAAGEVVRQAMAAGKHVVTANKELLAKHGPELLSLADQQGVDFYFEASVGGGIPIISPLRIGLAGNRIQKIVGIVNGTTNYILTQMAAEGGDLADVLKEAQQLGYAEADPTNDVEGYDARYKLTILATLGFHACVDVDDIYCEGIMKLQSRDVDYARELGYEVKLLAIAKRVDGGLEARVHPALVPFSHPLAAVAGVNNAIFVTGDAVGDVMFYGPGAGSLAAGSAVVGDVIEIARNIRCGATGRLKPIEFRDLDLVSTGESVARYYVRMLVKDASGVLAAIATEFGLHNVSIASLVQKDASEGVAEIIFLTHEVKERGMRAALECIEGLSVVEQVCSMIRVEE